MKRFLQKLIILILIIAVVSGVCFYTRSNSNTNSSQEETTLSEVTYIRAKDGDTLVVSDQGKEVTVRLIGVDTPESVHPDESKNTLEGKEASEYTKSLLQEGQKLYLEYDKERNDKYGRTLAYVWLSNDTKNINNMLNAKLLKDGAAIPLTVVPNIKYREEFSKIYNK